MNKEALIAAAADLKQPSQAAQEEFSQKREVMVQQLNELMLAVPGIDEIVPTEKQEMMQDNHHNQFRFMDSVYRSFSPEVLVNTMIWAFTTYRSHGFGVRYWDDLFPNILEVYRTRLSGPAYNELAPFYLWMNAHKADFLRLSDKG